MSRWFYAGCVLVVLALASIYIFIPSKLEVVKIVLVKCNADGADRVLGDTSSWRKWWPEGGEAATGDSAQGRLRFVFEERLLKAVKIEIHDKGGMGTERTGIPSVLNIFSLINKDSSYLQWKFMLDASFNPLKRIAQYQEATRLKDSMGVILTRLKDYLEKVENVYGVTVMEGMIAGNVLEEGSWTVSQYPGTDTIYQKVSRLEQFIKAHGQPIMGQPMVNVTSLAGGLFRLRVALGTNKEISNSWNMQFRNLPTGKFLYTDVRGGEATVRAAFGKMENYISDYQRTVMAIPFFSLITDRRKEADTTKWATRIFYPIL